MIELKKEINDLIANILFAKENDIFFPIVNPDDDVKLWKNIIVNKLKYISLQKYMA